MGYTSQQFLVCDNSSLANFKAWGSAISAAIAAMGWVQTADTGQVNWSTIAAIPSSNYVYEIWKPADALQTGATQFFLKMQYGFSTTRVAMQATLGTGTDGAGNLTGYTTSALPLLSTSNTANQGSTPYECDFSGDVDRLGMMLWRNSGSQFARALLAIERTKATDGTDSSDGVTLIGGTYGATQTQQTLVFGTGAAPVSATGNFNSPIDGNNASGAFANNVPVSPIFPCYGLYGNPMTTVCCVHTQDVAEGCFFTTTLYGSTRTYIASGMVGLAPGVTPKTANICLRYD